LELIRLLFRFLRFLLLFRLWFIWIKWIRIRILLKFIFIILSFLVLYHFFWFSTTLTNIWCPTQQTSWQWSFLVNFSFLFLFCNNLFPCFWVNYLKSKHWTSFFLYLFFIFIFWFTFNFIQSFTIRLFSFPRILFF
jgi:hypothetical protein